MSITKKIRLNKAIAACGLCSRRAADNFIADGKVKVNGKIITDFNFLVELNKDQLFVGDKKLLTNPHQYVILHKPQAVITTCQDEFGRKKILDLLPYNLRHLKPAGRLDYDSSGLLLLTNDGELINRLTHPSHGIEKTYHVTVAGRVAAQAINELRSGIDLRDGKTKPAQVSVIKDNGKESIIEIIIKEGKNRQIRRMCSQLGLTVVKLVRTAVSKLQLGGLPPGKWRFLTKYELSNLQKELHTQPLKNNEFRKYRTKTKNRT